MKEMMKIKRVDGGEDTAESIEVNMVSEHWSEAMLEDGSIIKIKSIITKVFKVPGQYDQDGNPLYYVRSTNVVAVASPESLKKGG